MSLCLTALFLAGCGGGGDPVATYIPAAIPPTPTVTLYQSLDLSNSIATARGILGGPTLIGCPTSTQTVQISNYVANMVTVNNITSYGTTYYFQLSGNFSLPNGGNITCNTNGMTGTIASANLLDVKSSQIYTLTGLNLDAIAIQNSWRDFWKLVIAQNGKVLLSQPSAATITCTNSTNQTFTIQATTSRDIAPDILKCLN